MFPPLSQKIRFCAFAIASLNPFTGYSQTADLAQKFREEIQPILVNYCYDCHGDGSSEGYLKLDNWQTIEEMIADRGEWKKIRDHIDFRLMPPPDEYAPGEEERKALVDWIDDAVFHVDPANPDPGHVTLRRLNRTEYENTVKDLLGVGIDTRGILPIDDSGYGFDNIGDVLTLSPLHMERYLEAADLALDNAVDISPPKYPEKVIEGAELEGAGSASGSARMFATTGKAEATLGRMKSGTYVVTARAVADEAGDEAAKMELQVNGKTATTWEVSEAAGLDYSFEIEIGDFDKITVSIGFLNDFYDVSLPEGRRDRNLLVESIKLEGPLEGEPLRKSKTHLAIFPEREGGQTDKDYMISVMKNFIVKAFRRPVRKGEAERYLAFLAHAEKQGKTTGYAIRQALAAVLVSPSFLFREEPGIEGGDGGKELITEHALASRLSYFLWSTMPDARLRKLADEGALRENLQEEIERMAKDKKAGRFVRNFAGQWLQLRDMDAVTPDKRIYGKHFNGRTAWQLKEETESLFRHIMEENLPMITLLSADYTFINGDLADYYEIDGVEGHEFRKVSLKGTPRRGLLGHGSFLTITSHPNRTSPVLRGKYVLENIFDTPPPPAPPNVPALEEDHGKGRVSQTLRKELELHRESPECASCHALMDPIGFGLENFDGIGRWREQDRGKPLDVAAKLVTGQRFSSPEELLEIFLRDYSNQFHRAVAVKMLTYALGRGTEYYDRTAIEEIVLKASEHEGRFLTWITAVAESGPFQYRRK